MLSRTSTTASAVCARCRYPPPLYRALHVSAALAFKADVGLTPRKPPRAKAKPAKPAYSSSSPKRFGGFKGPPPQKNLKEPTPARCRAVLSSELRRWARSPKTLDRLRVIGLEDDQSRRILSIFAEEEPRSADGWFPPGEDDIWQMQRMVDDASTDLQAAIDGILTRRFLRWALDTLDTPGRRIVPAQSRAALEAVYEALDYSRPPALFPFRGARMLRRTVHMHVGPTNSGKTHSALRALAAAKHGVYASPLRLLAHECFERLNRGQICPDSVDLESNPETWKRACNLVTGEEVRTIDPHAGLLSCTIEMLSFSSRYDVAVVDEIQMLADPERGGAWTAAVLGLHAKELHLCGEEAAVPLVKKMLEETGDEVVVHKYDRLTPLVAAPKSLRDDFKNIQKGDCIVSFSRTKLFDLKEKIEKVTGKRCAIIYGRLPPEVRAEQAELFNTPGNGYDVLVGSDAIGMGLNLKIKRIVFETTTKFDGHADIRLSLSQLKQIAGRAGRFGLHADDDAGGIVTTLSESDLPTVRKAISAPAVPHAKRAILPHAELPMLAALASVVRPQVGLKALFDLQRSGARLPDHYALPPATSEEEFVFEAVDGEDGSAGEYALHERVRVMNAPIQWRDVSVRAAARTFLVMYGRGELVHFGAACEQLGVFDALETVKEMRQASSSAVPSPPSPSSPPALQPNISTSSPFNEPATTTPSTQAPAPPLAVLLGLESLYRIAVVYMWFSLRLPLLFAERADAVVIKKECEDAIEWCLEVMRASKKKERKGRREERRMEREREEKEGRELGGMGEERESAKVEARTETREMRRVIAAA